MKLQIEIMFLSFFVVLVSHACWKICSSSWGYVFNVILLDFVSINQAKKKLRKKKWGCVFSFFPVLKPQKKKTRSLGPKPPISCRPRRFPFQHQDGQLSHVPGANFDHVAPPKPPKKLWETFVSKSSQNKNGQKWTHTNSCLVLYKFQIVSSFLSVSTGASFAQRQPLILSQNPISLSDMDL